MSSKKGRFWTGLFSSSSTKAKPGGRPDEKPASQPSDAKQGAAEPADDRAAENIATDRQLVADDTAMSSPAEPSDSTETRDPEKAGDPEEPREISETRDPGEPENPEGPRETSETRDPGALENPEEPRDISGDRIEDRSVPDASLKARAAGDVVGETGTPEAEVVETTPARPQQTRPQQTGPQQTGPQQTGPQQTGPQQTRPQKTGSQQNWLRRLTAGLTKSSQRLTDRVSSVIRKRKLDDDLLQDIEDVLIGADLGPATAMAITESLAKSRYDKQVTLDDVRRIMAQEIETILAPLAAPLNIDPAHAPHIILVVGVNGTGKTTTIGKLAARFVGERYKVMLAAGDMFRAAAVEQLQIWGKRAGAGVITGKGKDPSGLVYDAIDAARQQQADILLIDTAGRLQNKVELMAELEKIVRVIKKRVPDGPHDVILVLDATTGANALQQVALFDQSCPLSGLIMTKLDGSARGGVLVAISARHKIPIHAIGVGEAIDDLQTFSATEFSQAIAGIELDAA